MKLLDWIDRALVVVACIALSAIMILTTISVFGRYFFAAPIPDDLVMSEILMVFVAFLPLSYVQARREHVFVTIFTDWMSTGWKVFLETVGTLIGTFIFTIVAWAVFTNFLDAWETGSYFDGPLQLPEWPGRLVVACGLALFALRLVIDSIAAVIGLVTGRAVASRSEFETLLEREA